MYFNYEEAKSKEYVANNMASEFNDYCRERFLQRSHIPPTMLVENTFEENFNGNFIFGDKINS